MPKLFAILQLVSAPLNPIPIVEHFFSYACSTLVSSQSFSKVSRNASTSKSGCERDGQKVQCVSPKLIKLTE